MMDRRNKLVHCSNFTSPDNKWIIISTFGAKTPVALISPNGRVEAPNSLVRQGVRRLVSSPAGVGQILLSNNRIVQILQYFQFVVLLLAIPLFTAKAQQSPSPFQQLTERFADGAVFAAKFTHHYEDSYTGNISEKSGQLWIGREKYKIKSPAQLVAVDGTISRVYDSNRNRLIVSEYVPEEDDFAPSRILNGVDSTYTVNKQQKTENGFLIELSSDDPFAIFQSVKITLNEDGVPQKIFVKDTADNLITTSFSSGSFIKRTSNMFDFAYPADAEVIDMRNNAE